MHYQAPTPKTAALMPRIPLLLKVPALSVVHSTRIEPDTCKPSTGGPLMHPLCSVPFLERPVRKRAIPLRFPLYVTSSGKN